MPLLAVAAVLGSLAGCGLLVDGDGPPGASPTATVGPQPTLGAPDPGLLPTVRVAPVVGWANGAGPQAAPGLQVQAFARGLDHPRWVYSLPNGDVLVAESNAPPRPQDEAGLMGRVTTWVMGRAGATVPSANRITLLRDVDGDGVAEVRNVFLQGLNSPFGMALVGNALYVANTDGVMRYDYQPGQQVITGPGRLLTDLPAGPRNHHWTKNILASADGSTLYATVGSNSNIAEYGMAAEAGRAAIWQIKLADGSKRLFATGLRNPNGMAFAPGSQTLWTVANERDELGNDLVPDYLTSVQDGGFYGWPYSYFGQRVDTRVQPQRPDLVAKALAPDYALGAHVAALGLAARDGSVGTGWPAAFAQGMFIGLHGSWNRQPPVGYKLVFVPFSAGQPSGVPIDVLTGFVNAQGKAQGRPVGVALARDGALLVADDVGNTIWRVSPPAAAK